MTTNAVPPPSGARRRRVRSTLGIAGVVLALTVPMGCSRSAGATGTGAVYAALGDSYSSGAGIAPVADASCYRSGADFGALVAKRMGYTPFEDVSCGGAATDNLLRPQATQGADNGPQLDAVGSRTRLVTLTLGLNDSGLSSVLLYGCQAPTGVPSDYCKLLVQSSPAQAEKGFSAAADRLEKALRAIRRAAPSARIVLVGYPRLYPDAGSCPDRVPMAEQMVPVLRDAMETINDKWKRAAADVGADYVDTWSMSEGHDLCSADPWVNGAQDKPGIAAPMHPYPAFHQAVADAIVALLKGS
jgi:lysophospholipase L1-like esterase